MKINSSRVEDLSGHEACEKVTVNVPLDDGVTPAAPSEVHKVCLPPHKTTWEKLSQRLGEIFFPDDPFHRFRNQTPARQFLLGLQFFFPIFEWAPNYTLKLLRSDIIAGLTIASLSIPQGISYAKLANLPPIIGLYSSFVPPLIYSVLGSSRNLSVGPVSIASLVMGTTLSEVVHHEKNPTLYIKLAFTATFVAGIFQASLGVFRLGFLIDFLSKATLLGFMAGAAVIVSLQQLKGLLGIVHFTNQMQIIPVLTSVFHHKDEWSWQTVVMGVSFLIVLLTARQIGIWKPKLFWVSAAAPLLSVILSTAIVSLFKEKANMFQTIGQLPKGINPPSINMLYFHGPYVSHAIKTGIIAGVLSLTEGIAVGRTFATLNNYQIDGNKEMMAIGLMNMAGCCASCYVTTGSFSRSAVNNNAGGQTAVSNIVMATAVLITLLFLMPLFYYTPNVILAAIIITAVIGLIDYKAALQLWKVDKLDFFACMCSFFGVLFISVPIGLGIAVSVSILKILLHVTRPNTHVLGNIPGTHVYESIGRYKTATRIPTFLVLSVESPIYFANSTYIQDRVIRWIREEEERITANKESAIKCVILDMTAVTAIDTSGIDTIHELRKALERKSLKLVLTSPVGSVAEKMHKSGTLEAFESNAFYMTVAEAVSDISTSYIPEP